MARRNRASQLKRQREAEKRERLAKKAAKNLLKRERRMLKDGAEPQIASDGETEQNGASPDLPAETRDVNPDVTALGSGAIGQGTSTS